VVQICVVFLEVLYGGSKMNALNHSFNRLIFGAILVLFTSSQAMAEEFVCTEMLGRVIVDNLRVPDNETCDLHGTRVEGTIKVETNAKLNAWRISVIGNIQAKNAGQINILDRSRIGGSVQLKQGGGATISDSVIDSDLQFDSNSGHFQALRNDIGGNLQIFQNTDDIEIVKNVIDGNLQCKGNMQPLFGGGNVVKGNEEDQCEQLSVRVSSVDNCDKSNPTFDDVQLRIPRVSVAGQADIVDYWATLRYVPELSHDGRLVFELTNVSENLGRCN
jgi:hypothetical protein